MRFKNIILSFLLVLTVSSLTRANDPGMRSSLRVTLEQLNRLKKVFKTAPLSPSLKTLENSDSLPIPKDLDKSQLVEEVLSQDTPESQPPKSNLSVLQSLYVKSDRIIIYSIGDDPTIVVDAEKEPGMTHITLQGVQIDPRFKLFQNSDQTEPSIGFVQVNAIAPSNPEDMTTASVEISIKTDHKNWQLIPRQGGFLLSKSDSPVNSDISTTVSEQISPEVSQAISKTASNAEPAVDQGMTIDSGIPSVNELVPSTKSDSVVENPVTPVQAVEDNLPIQQSPQAKISETLPPDVTNTESFFKSSIPTEQPSTEISQTVDYPIPLSKPDN